MKEEDLKVQIPPELREIEQKEVAIAIGDNIYRLQKVKGKASKEVFLDLAKVYSLAGIAELRDRYLAAICEAERAQQRLVQEFVSRLPNFKMIYEEGIMVSVEVGQMKVIMPFKLKVEYAENYKIISPKIERDVHIRFDICISRGDYYTISHAELVKWDPTGGKFKIFPHYHLMSSNHTCWGSYNPNSNIRSFTELIEIRNRAQWVLKNMGHRPHEQMNYKGLPKWSELKLGKQQVVIHPYHVGAQLKVEGAIQEKYI